MVDDALPALTPRREAAQTSQQGSSSSPRRRRALRQVKSSYESPRRAVRDSIGGVATLPPPPKSFALVYGRRRDWAEVTGLQRGDDERGYPSALSPRTEYTQSSWLRSSMLSIGRLDPSALSTEQLWDQQLADRHNARVSQQQAHEKKWETQVKPYFQHQKAKGRHKTNIEQQLERFRKEEINMEKKLAARRLVRDKLGRKLLKDISFLLEKHKDRVLDARIGEMNTNQDSTESHEARKQHELRQVEKSLDELKAAEITETKLRTIENVHKSMLKDLFHFMDHDGGGVLDQQELRTLSLTLGYKLTDKELAAAMAEMDEDGSGEVDFTEFYQWWTNPKKATTLQGSTHSSFFEIEPY